MLRLALGLETMGMKTNGHFSELRFFIAAGDDVDTIPHKLLFTYMKNCTINSTNPSKSCNDCVLDQIPNVCSEFQKNIAQKQISSKRPRNRKAQKEAQKGFIFPLKKVDYLGSDNENRTTKEKTRW